MIRSQSLLTAILSPRIIKEIRDGKEYSKIIERFQGTLCEVMSASSVPQVLTCTFVQLPLFFTLMLHHLLSYQVPWIPMTLSHCW
jgi:hypothetical protein